MVCNIKVIPNEECVPKHKLLVMDMRFNITKRWCKKFEPTVRVWKLSEKKTCEEYQSMVRYKVEEAEWKYLNLVIFNTLFMKQESKSTGDICGRPC